MYAVGGMENFPSGDIMDELVCKWFCKYSYLIKDRGAKPKWGNLNLKSDESQVRFPSLVFSPKGAQSRVSFQKSIDMEQSRQYLH